MKGKSDHRYRKISPDSLLWTISFAIGFSETWEVELVDGEDCSKGLQDVILKERIEL